MILNIQIPKKCATILIAFLLLWPGSWVKANHNTGQSRRQIQPGDVVINEFKAKGQEWIELYNPTGEPIDISHWYLDDDPCAQNKSPIYDTILPPGEYLVIEPYEPGWGLNKLSGDGETLYLCTPGHMAVDSVAYGVAGGAPVPPKGHSASRVINGKDTDDDANDWNIAPDTTKGKPNNVAPVNLGQSLIINEVNRDPLPNEPAIELYNPTSVPLSINGWQICDGDDLETLKTNRVIPPKGLLVINPDDYGVSLTTEDVLYLFEPDGTRVDQVGFSYRDWDNTFQRVPNGTGPHNGYDWTSSGGGITWLYLPESLGYTNLYAEGLQGGIVNWPQNRRALGRLSQNFENAKGDICTTANILIAAAASGFNAGAWTAATGKTPLDYLENQINAIDVNDPQELSCAIMALLTTGQDPYHTASGNLVERLAANQNTQTGQYSTDLRTHTYALLALHNAGEPVSHQAITYLLQHRTTDGAWASNGATTPNQADTTTTALAVQALIAAGETDAARATLAYFQRVQNQDGGFRQQENQSLPTDTIATALALQALNLLNEPMGNWTPHGTDIKGSILSLWNEKTGGYRQSSEQTYNDLQATALAIQALEGATLVAIPVQFTTQQP